MGYFPAKNQVGCLRPCSSYHVQFHDVTMYPKAINNRKIRLIMPDHISKVETVLAVRFKGNTYASINKGITIPLLKYMFFSFSDLNPSEQREARLCSMLQCFTNEIKGIKKSITK